MKKFSLLILLTGGASVLFPCCEKKEKGHEALDRAQIKRQSAITADASLLQRVLGARSSRSPMNREDSATLDRQISSLSSKDLLKLLEETTKSRNTPGDRALFQFAVSEYAKRNPENVMSWFDPGTMVRGEAGFIEASRVLAKSRPDVLQAWLSNEMSNADHGVQNECMNVGLGLLSSVNPKSAFEFAMSRKWEAIPMYEIVNAIFVDFGKQNPDEADRAAVTLLKGKDLESARRLIAMATAEENPDLALRFAAKLSSPEGRGEASSYILSVMMDSDKAAVLGKLQVLNPVELQATLQPNYVGDTNSVVAKLGKSDPEFLTALLAKILPSASSRSIFEAAVHSLAGKHPEESMEIIQSLPDSPMKSKLFSEHYSALVKEDSHGALEAASALTDPELRAVAYHSIGEFAGLKGWAETSKMLGSMRDDDKASFLGSAAPYLAANNPKELANLMSSGTIALEDGNKSEILSRLGARLNSTDPTFAKSWLDGLPVEEQPSAMKGIARDMAKTDVNRLATMLQSMKQDRKWEEGVKVLIDNIQVTDPDMANQWKGVLKEAGYSE